MVWAVWAAQIKGRGLLQAGGSGCAARVCGERRRAVGSSRLRRVVCAGVGARVRTTSLQAQHQGGEACQATPQRSSRPAAALGSPAPQQAAPHHSRHHRPPSPGRPHDAPAPAGARAPGWSLPCRPAPSRPCSGPSQRLPLLAHAQQRATAHSRASHPPPRIRKPVRPRVCPCPGAWHFWRIHAASCELMRCPGVCMCIPVCAHQAHATVCGSTGYQPRSPAMDRSMCHHFAQQHLPGCHRTQCTCGAPWR